MRANMPSRLRFRFSLAALFTAMTVLGAGVGWLGCQVEIVREREAVQRRFEATWEVEFVDAAEDFWITTTDDVTEVRSHGRSCAPSWIRKALGDREIAMIFFLYPPAAAEIELVSVFPEATVLKPMHPGLKTKYRTFSMTSGPPP